MATSQAQSSADTAVLTAKERTTLLQLLNRVIENSDSMGYNYLEVKSLTSIYNKIEQSK